MFSTAIAISFKEFSLKLLITTRALLKRRQKLLKTSGEAWYLKGGDILREMVSFESEGEKKRDKRTSPRLNQFMARKLVEEFLGGHASNPTVDSLNLRGQAARAGCRHNDRKVNFSKTT